ncbi:hypothetical protein JCM10295v2_001967 [Rhodotorula toruloides]
MLSASPYVRYGIALGFALLLLHFLGPATSPSDCLEYSLFVETSMGRERGCCNAASNYWFRHALDGKHSRAGLGVAIDADPYPARTPAIWPNAPQERGGKLELPGFAAGTGGRPVNIIITHRHDEPGEVGPIERYSDWPNCLLVFEKFYVPLIDLLVSRRTAADDITVDFGEELDEEELDAYIDEDYDSLSWIKPAEERRLAHGFIEWRDHIMNASGRGECAWRYR